MNNWIAWVLIIASTAIISCSSNEPPTAQSEIISSSPIIQKVHLDTTPIDTPIVQDTMPKEVLLGKINPSNEADFSLIAAKYTSKSGIYMRKEAYEAFEKMYTAAEKDGVKLIIISATRPFNSQKEIWEAKWSGSRLVGGKNLSVSVPDPVERAKTILRYSSMPGTSRHHWGTDIDLNDLENSYFDAGTGKKIYDWLTSNAAEYGFCQPYSVVGPARPRGYQEERWHWSYMPISSKFLQAYRNQIQLEDIKGFKGSETAKGLNVIEDYVSGIAGPCREWNPTKTD